MKCIIGLVFVLAIPVALFADNTNDVNKELKALEGKWKAVAMEAGGETVPQGKRPGLHVYRRCQRQSDRPIARGRISSDDHRRSREDPQDN